MLTTSENDHEALSAIRMANALLKKQKTCWLEVLSVEGARQELEEKEYDRTQTKKYYSFGRVDETKQMLEELDLNYFSKNNDLHFIFYVEGRRVDYYPSTGTTLIDSRKKGKWSPRTLSQWILKVRA
jgi:hypothetical protein